MTTTKRNADFSTTGEHTVTIGDSSFTIYRDPSNGWWYEMVSGKHFSQCVIGFTKKEAIKALEERVAAAAAPAAVEVPAAAPVSSWKVEKQQIADAVATFPETFGLRAFPGDTFRVSPGHSYMGSDGAIQVYTERLCEDGVWKSFAKGTVPELTLEVVKVPVPAIEKTCQWFLLCENPATTTVAHPVLGAVPCCARCAARAGGGAYPEIEDPKGRPNDDVSMADDIDAIEETTPATGALDEAIAMLETIAKGKSYDSLEYHQKLAAIKQVRAQTVTVDAALWKSMTFFVEGLAMMQTTRQSHPALHGEVVKLARQLETIGGVAR